MVQYTSLVIRQRIQRNSTAVVRRSPKPLTGVRFPLPLLVIRLSSVACDIWRLFVLFGIKVGAKFERMQIGMRVV